MKLPKFENKIRVNVCMTPSQKAKLKQLGGSKFVQWVIENTIDAIPQKLNDDHAKQKRKNK